MEILETASKSSSDSGALVITTLSAILLTCFMDTNSWAVFRGNSNVPEIFKTILLLDRRGEVRRDAAMLIEERVLSIQEYASSHRPLWAPS